MIERVAVGGVQFGMDYGVAGGHRVAPSEVSRILRMARARGLDTLDTAIVYGNSEEVLGGAGVAHWRVVSKLPAVPLDCRDVQAWILGAVRGSLERLRIPSLHGLLLHRSSDLLGESADAVFAGLEECRKLGLAKKVGLSIYDPAELGPVLSKYPCGLVQSPFSVFDRRLRETGWLDRLAKRGVEIHVRSVFLQGLLLLPDSQRPAAFARWGAQWARWQNWLAASGSSPVSACLRYVLQHEEIDRAIVGVYSCAQLQDIVESDVESGPIPPDSLACNDLDLINPSRWNNA